MDSSSTDFSSTQDEIDILECQIADIEGHQQQPEHYDDVFAIEVSIPSTSSLHNHKSENKKKMKVKSNFNPKAIKMGERKCFTKGTAIVLGVALVAGAIIGLMAFAHLLKNEDIHFMAASNRAAQTANIITLEELSLHNTADDCWVVYYGIVYDMTNYARRHPGGRDVITRLAGTDGTDAYELFHSESLLLSVQDRIMGTLSTDDAEGYIEENNADWNSNTDTDNASSTGTSPYTMKDCLLEGNNCVTTAELQSHNSVSDCWVALYGIVYDLTVYAKDHPGGSNFVTDLAGTDGTVAYERFHPESLLDSVQGNIVGILFLPSMGDTANEDIINGNHGDRGNNNTNDNHDDTSSSSTTSVPTSTTTEDDCLDCITLAELQRHNTASDCWVALYGIVYDLTNYVRYHPGGSRIVTDLAGTDGTYEYTRFHRQSLLRFVQGDIVGTLLLFPSSGGGGNENEGIHNNNNNNNNHSNQNDYNDYDDHNTPASSTPPPSSVEEDDCPDCITMTELQRHNTASDCWVALYGIVYDLTNYARRHPGGSRIITELAGTDGTYEYTRFHGESLLRSVQDDIVGTLTFSIPDNSVSAGTDNDEDNDNEGEEDTSSGGGGDVDCSWEEGTCVVTITELQYHNTASDCWVALYGNVYDLTNYARHHPGGSRIITELAGTDGTREFSRFHRERLLNDVRNDLIGPFEGYD